MTAYVNDLRAPETTLPRAASFVEFRAIKLGVRPLVRVTRGALTYEQRYANWLTWLLVVFTGGAAAFAWPWILFGRRELTIPRERISHVEAKSGSTLSTLRVMSATSVIGFRTDVATAHAARELLTA